MNIKTMGFFILCLLPFSYFAQSSRWLIEGGSHATVFSFRPKPDKITGFLYKRIDTLVWGVGSNISYLVWTDEEYASFSIQATPKIGFSTETNSNLKSVATALYAQMRWGGGCANRSPYPVGFGAGLGIGAWYYTVNARDAYNYGISPLLNIEFTINIDEFPVVFKYEQSINGSAANSKYYALSITGRWRSLFKK